MKGKTVATLATALLLGLLALPAMADRPSQTGPGSLNYVEGQVTVGTQQLSSKSVGSAELQVGQALTTQTGKAEILLTPGVYLRVGDNSSVKMISPSLTNTEVEVQRGEAQLEVDQIFPQNDLRVLEDGTTTRLQKKGIYDFNADQRTVRVLDGQAFLTEGDNGIKIKGGHEVALDGSPLKSVKFDKKNFQADNELYRWSSLRSEYLAEASVETGRTYVVNGGYGPGWWGAGWYWNPWFGAYTFLPADGILYSPFGWGFYSPLWAYRVPFYNGGSYRHFGPGWTPAHRGWAAEGRPSGAITTHNGFHGGETHAGGFGSGGFGGFGHAR